MGTTTKISFEDFQKLQETADEAIRYELDEGELIVTPSPTLRHDLVSFRLRSALNAFVETHHLGTVTGEIDFRLSNSVVRKPDIAILTNDQMKTVDPDQVPIDGAPLLAVEVISPSNLAEDMRKKVNQYLAAGSHAVWLVYPQLKVIEIHDRDGIRGATEQDLFEENQLFPDFVFSLSLAALFK